MGKEEGDQGLLELALGSLQLTFRLLESKPRLLDLVLSVIGADRHRSRFIPCLLSPPPQHDTLRLFSRATNQERRKEGVVQRLHINKERYQRKIRKETRVTDQLSLQISHVLDQLLVLGLWNNRPPPTDAHTKARENRRARYVSR